MNARFSKVLIAVVVVFLVVPAFILLTIRYKHNEEGQVFCTMEAKMCPDGSFVGRSGPKCEFKECPTTATNKTVIGQKITVNGVGITPLSLVSDSRCPSDVECIWAGTVTIKAKLEKGGNTQEVVLDLGKPVTFANQEVTLSSVSPEIKQTVGIKITDYIFTFFVN